MSVQQLFSRIEATLKPSQLSRQPKSKLRPLPSVLEIRNSNKIRDKTRASLQTCPLMKKANIDVCLLKLEPKLLKRRNKPISSRKHNLLLLKAWLTNQRPNLSRKELSLSKTQRLWQDFGPVRRP